jgi:hypothetical protein
MPRRISNPISSARWWRTCRGCVAGVAFLRVELERLTRPLCFCGCEQQLGSGPPLLDPTDAQRVYKQLYTCSQLVHDAGGSVCVLFVCVRVCLVLRPAPHGICIGGSSALARLCRPICAVSLWRTFGEYAGPKGRISAAAPFSPHEPRPHCCVAGTLCAHRHWPPSWTQGPCLSTAPYWDWCTSLCDI